MIQSLADVMEQAGTLGDALINTQFGRHDAAQNRTLDRMPQDILGVAGAISEATEDAQEIGMHIGDTHLVGGIHPAWWVTSSISFLTFSTVSFL